jgi:hypothetical protein
MAVPIICRTWVNIFVSIFFRLLFPSEEVYYIRSLNLINTAMLRFGIKLMISDQIISEILLSVGFCCIVDFSAKSGSLATMHTANP